MELSAEKLARLGCREDQDTCPCVPCMARRDLKEAMRLMKLTVDGYRSGAIMSSDKTGYLQGIQYMEAFLREPSNGGESNA